MPETQERREIGLFSYCVAANQDIVGTQPCRSRSFSGTVIIERGKTLRTQTIAGQTRGGAFGRAYSRARTANLPGFTLRGRSADLSPRTTAPFALLNATAGPPAVTDSLICPCSTREVLPRGDLSLQHRDAWRRQWQYASVDGGVPRPYKPTFAKLSRRKLSARSWLIPSQQRRPLAKLSAAQ